MKKSIKLVVFVVSIVFLGNTLSVHASSMGLLINKLVEKGILTSGEGALILDQNKQEVAFAVEQATERSKEETKEKWTDKIKVSGDLRYRTQFETPKSATVSNSEKTRVRQRVRARVSVKGKVNDQISGEVRIATGADNGARTTNQTLGDSGSGKGDFTKWQLWVDRAYIKWEPEFKYFDRSTVLAGKIANPFVVTPMTWDSDVSPEGIIFNYITPVWKTQGKADISAYATGGWLWLDYLKDNSGFKGIWAVQTGVNAALTDERETKLAMNIGYFNPTNMKNKSVADGSSQTNSRIGSNYRYDLHWFDMIVSLDSRSFWSDQIDNGLWFDLAWNPSVNHDNLAWNIGAYLGKKKVKEVGQWKIFGEYKHMERDAVPDFLPDADFFGFTSSGEGKGGGTNGQGFVFGAEYGILKNTSFAIKWCWSTPITSTTVLDQSYQVVQLDVKTKF